MYTNTIGYKNNNYGNIRALKGAKFQGVTGENKGFLVFDKPENGARAIMKILFSYKESGANTVEKMISKYAPASENDTKAYISFVANQVGVKSNEILTLEKTQLFRLVKAIIRKEIGFICPESTLQNAFDNLNRKSYTVTQISGIVVLFFLAILFFLLKN